MYKEFGISEKLEALANETENEVKEVFKQIDNNTIRNSIKVLKAFQNNQISDSHFGTSTGYGYDDIGREVIEKIYSEIFKTESALVRGQFISASHALNVTFFGLLRPNDTMLSITGLPYDTLHEIIGIKENSSSLKSSLYAKGQIPIISLSFLNAQL